MTTRPRPTAAAASSSAVGWEVSAVVVAHCDTLTSVTRGACERVAAAHRLNELFASCQSREAAGHLASAACSLAVVVALLDLLVHVGTFLLLYPKLHPASHLQA